MDTTMLNHTAPDKTEQLMDGLDQGAEAAIRSAQRLTHAALESLSEGMRELKDSGQPALDGAFRQADHLKQRGLDAWHDGTHRLQEQARHASDSTVNRIRKEPVQSMLIAVAAGAAVMALVSAWSGPRGRS